MHADYSGHASGSGPGAGYNKNVHSLGGSGGGHGGRGGRARHAYSSALAYGSLYEPVQMGSGGGLGSVLTSQAGGRGGGIILYFGEV